MASSGDPSTFTFTIDAFPAYTQFDKTKKVLAAIQILDPSVASHNYKDFSVVGHGAERYEYDSDEYYDAIYSEASVFATTSAAVTGATAPTAATTTGD